LLVACTKTADKSAAKLKLEKVWQERLVTPWEALPGRVRLVRDSVVVVDGTGSENARVCCFNAADGAKQWVIDGKEPLSVPEFGAVRVCIVGIDVRTGDPIWGFRAVRTHWNDRGPHRAATGQPHGCRRDPVVRWQATRFHRRQPAERGGERSAVARLGQRARLVGQGSERLRHPGLAQRLADVSEKWLVMSWDGCIEVHRITNA
jgi:hypothetical protein